MYGVTAWGRRVVDFAESRVDRLAPGTGLNITGERLERQLTQGSTPQNEERSVERSTLTVP
jgi:hypothetical protein